MYSNYVALQSIMFERSSSLPNIEATSMYQQHMCLIRLKVEQSAFTQAFSQAYLAFMSARVALVLHGQTLFSCRGIITFSISLSLEKGSERVYSTHSY